MKLNPPASSSDLEAARAIARRLHQRRRSADRGDVEHRADGPTPVIAPAPLHTLPLHDPMPQPAAPEPTLEETPSPFDTALPFETADAAPAPADEPPADEPAAPVHEAVFELPASMGFEPAPVTEDTAPPSWDDAEGPAEVTPSGIVTLEDLAPAPPAPDETSEAAPELPLDSGDVSPDTMIGRPEAAEDDASPFDEAEAEDGIEEELFDATPPPSWDEVVQSCLELASASAAMIVDPAGQVFAARGSWPEPGPEAIAGRLVAMMERTLRDAPTRSISAPLGGQHLTAWRVPLAEGLVTAAFVGDAPLRVELRPTIDAEIHRGPGA